MLTGRRLTKYQGAEPILVEVSISVGPQNRLGMVGRNGIGKSTLLRILAGIDLADSGSVERSPANLTVGYLAQEPDAREGETLASYLARRTGVAEASAELDRWTDAMASDASEGTVAAYSAALERYLALGGDDLSARAATVCAELGLPADRMNALISSLSGGQAARAGLAAILLSKYDVFLLDEPTNDLDFDGLDLLERFVTSLPGAVVAVSHDRAFLDRTVDRILEIQDESHRGVEYAGGWSEFVAARALARSQQEEAYRAFTTEKERLTERARTQRSWSMQGVRSEKTRPRDNDKAQRGFRVNRTEKQASKVRASERRIEQLDVVEKPWEPWRLQLSLAAAKRSGDVVARLEGAMVQRGQFVLGPVDLEIGWQDRVAILGRNGSGKSTLLAALLGTVPLAAGRRYAGPGAVFGEMDQRRDVFSRDLTVKQVFAAETGLGPEEARSLLAKFGLGADHVIRPGWALSPGERSRAILAGLMASGVNCLVLDEPTNHLDLEAIEQLEQGLDGFDGTLLLVTHDRRFLEAVKVTRTVTVDRGQVSARSS